MLVVPVLRRSSYLQMSDYKVRMIDIMEDEQAVIRVRTKFHIELVFDNMVVDMFEKDGVLFTRQEYHKPDFDVRSEGDIEYDGNAETQAMEGYTQIEDYDISTTDESPDITTWCGGSFDEINEAYENELQEGDTQIDDFATETQTEDCYDGDVYIPSYIRMNKYLTGVH